MATTELIRHIYLKRIDRSDFTRKQTNTKSKKRAFRNL